MAKENVITWLMGSRSSDPLIRFGRLSLIFFAIAATVATYSGGNLPRLIFLAVFALGFAITIWAAAEIMQSKNRVLFILGRLLAATLLVSTVALFVATIWMMLTGQPASLKRLIGNETTFNLESNFAKLDSPNMAARLDALSKLQDQPPNDASQLQGSVRLLGAFIARRAAEPPEAGKRQASDIEGAIATLGRFLKLADIRSINVRPLEFSSINLSALNLSNSYFPGVRFSATQFDDSILDGADFSKASLADVKLSRVSAANINMRAAKIESICAEESNFAGADFSGAEISSSDFNGSQFKTSNLSGVTFKNTRLAQVSFDAANTEKSDFSTALEMDSKKQLRNAMAAGSGAIPAKSYIKSRLSACKQY